MVSLLLWCQKEGVTPKAFVDKYHSLMKKAFGDFGISFDIYSRTSNLVHYETAQEFFKNIYDKGIFLEETSDQYYDEQGGNFSGGPVYHWNMSEMWQPKCVWWSMREVRYEFEPEGVDKSRSTVSGKTPVLKPTKHWYFPLINTKTGWKEWIVEGHKDDWKTNVYGQCKSWIDQGIATTLNHARSGLGSTCSVERWKGQGAIRLVRCTDWIHLGNKRT